LVVAIDAHRSGPADGTSGEDGGVPDVNYSFGSGDPAAERLLVLADVFAPTMRALLAELPRRRWRSVVDLGCGPGSTTTGLRRELDAERITGVDASEAFVAEARRRVPDAEFVVGDVLADPWPVPPPDLVYARFLLSHLGDPLAALRHWRAQLADGGSVVVEEPERIDTDVAVFDEYLSLTKGLVASRGAVMLVGDQLAGLGDNDGVALNRAFPLDVATANAARMFHLNLLSWRDDPWIAAHQRPDALDALDAELVAHVQGERRGSIHWTVRQLIVNR
jgi:SAM-dependent methyltransferase